MGPVHLLQEIQQSHTGRIWGSATPILISSSVHHIPSVQVRIDIKHQSQKEEGAAGDTAESHRENLGICHTHPCLFLCPSHTKCLGENRYKTLELEGGRRCRRYSRVLQAESGGESLSVWIYHIHLCQLVKGYQLFLELHTRLHAESYGEQHLHEKKLPYKFS